MVLIWPFFSVLVTQNLGYPERWRYWLICSFVDLSSDTGIIMSCHQISADFMLTNWQRYVCMYVFMYICVRVCMCVFMSVRCMFCTYMWISNRDVATWLHFLSRMCTINHLMISIINPLRSRLNRRPPADDSFKCIFLNENVWLYSKLSLKFVPKDPINNIPALV